LSLFWQKVLSLRKKSCNSYFLLVLKNKSIILRLVEIFLCSYFLQEKFKIVFADFEKYIYLFICFSEFSVQYDPGWDCLFLWDPAYRPHGVLRGRQGAHRHGKIFIFTTVFSKNSCYFRHTVLTPLPLPKKSEVSRPFSSKNRCYCKHINPAKIVVSVNILTPLPLPQLKNKQIVC
jgi:hypothetical protein